MKKVLVVFLCMMLFVIAADAETLKVGMECNYAPYNWTQSEPSENAVAIEAGGYADGYDVRIAKIIADALGMDLEVVKTEWDGLVPSLLSGKIDCIIAGMSDTPERRQTISFTKSYYDSELCIVVRKDSAYASATKLSDFSGAKITGQLNTFHYDIIDDIPDVKKQPAMETFPAMTVAVTAGAIDGYVAERPNAVSVTTSNPDLTFVTFADGEGFTSIAPEDVSISVGIAQGSPLEEKINAVLDTISAEQRSEIMDAAVAAQPLE